MAKNDSSATPKIPNGVRVVSKTQGFRRAGRAWSVTPTDVLLEALGQEQLVQLRAEPMLVVTDIVIEPAAEQ